MKKKMKGVVFHGIGDISIEGLDCRSEKLDPTKFLTDFELRI